MLVRRRDGSSVPRLTNPVQIAATVGFETLPAWSPDGRTIAYQSDQTGNNDIWVAQIGGAAVNRTAGFPGGDEMPRWSPDGTQIAFWSARDGGGVFLMPALGGSARKIGVARPDVAGGVAWSPDGTEIAYPVVGSVADGRRRLEFLNVRTNVIHAVAIPSTGGGVFGGSLDMSWSPDGRFIAILQANSYNNQTATISTLSLKDQKFTQITESQIVNWSPRWLPDSRTILYTSNRGGTMDVWQQRITDAGEAAGEAVRVTTGLDALQIAVAPDGRRLAYAKGKQRLANVWRVPILDNRLATWADAQQLTFDQAWVEAIDVSPDGQRLAIQSDRSGNADVWILPAAGGEMQQLTTDPASDLWPAWSPDGRDIAFYSNRGVGTREIWVQSVTGGPARQVTHGGGSFPRWSHDGRNIFFDAQGEGVSVVAASGGESRQIMKTGSQGLLGTMEFSLAPDGRSFVLAASRSTVRRIWRAPASGGDLQPLTNEQAGAPSWSRDGRWVYFTTYRDSPGTSYQLERPGLNIWRVSSDGAREQPVTQLIGRRGWLGQNITNDGRYLYFTWREDVADIWMMDVVRP
jgi:Tol biopolymer transport system component